MTHPPNPETAHPRNKLSGVCAKHESLHGASLLPCSLVRLNVRPTSAFHTRGPGRSLTGCRALPTGSPKRGEATAGVDGRFSAKCLLRATRVRYLPRGTTCSPTPLPTGSPLVSKFGCNARRPPKWWSQFRYDLLAPPPLNRPRIEWFRQSAVPTHHRRWSAGSFARVPSGGRPPTWWAL